MKVRELQRKRPKTPPPPPPFHPNFSSVLWLLSCLECSWYNLDNTDKVRICNQIPCGAHFGCCRWQQWDTTSVLHFPGIMSNIADGTLLQLHLMIKLTFQTLLFVRLVWDFLLVFVVFGWVSLWSLFFGFCLLF